MIFSLDTCGSCDLACSQLVLIFKRVLLSSVTTRALVLACSWPVRSPSRNRRRSLFGFHLFLRGIQLTFEKHIHVIQVVNSAVRSCRIDLVVEYLMFSVCHRFELGLQLLIFFVSKIRIILLLGVRRHHVETLELMHGVFLHVVHRVKRLDAPSSASFSTSGRAWQNSPKLRRPAPRATERRPQIKVAETRSRWRSARPN